MYIHYRYYDLLWNKIYKKDLWDKCFPYYNAIQEHLIMTEDIAFSSLLFYNAQRVATVKNDAYFYCENGDSSTNVEKIKIGRFEKNIKDITLVFNFVQGYLEKVNADQVIRENFNPRIFGGSTPPKMPRRLVMVICWQA